MFKNKEKPLIQFVSTIPGFETVADATPKPSKAFTPEWFKSLPLEVDGVFTARICPSFPDFFSQGYIMPFWMDTDFKYNDEEDRWNIRSSEYHKNWSAHVPKQFLDHVDARYQSEDARYVFKANSPWRIITPPGYSVLQLPLFYHYDRDYSVLPGIIDTDIHHEVNQQVMYHGKSDYFKINRGDPFAMYIPFKRIKPKLSIERITDEYRQIFDNQELDIFTKFLNNGTYRRRQRDRDKKV